jgi:hypothetical protein
MVTQGLVAGRCGFARYRQRTHHLVQALAEVAKLARSARIDGRLELTVANTPDMSEQRCDGRHDRLAERTMLTHGKQKYCQKDQ